MNRAIQAWQPLHVTSVSVMLPRAVDRQRLARFERAKVGRLAGESVVDIRHRDAAIDRRRRRVSDGNQDP